jgi:hypothetical protein
MPSKEELGLDQFIATAEQRLKGLLSGFKWTEEECKDVCIL